MENKQKTVLKDFQKKFKIKELTVLEFKYWLLSIRPQQPTIGSMVISLKRSSDNLKSLLSEEAQELSIVFSNTEILLKEAFGFDKINYLCLMMVDRQVHFHVIPRYSLPVQMFGKSFVDNTWPGPPDLSISISNDAELNKIHNHLVENLEKKHQIIGYTTGVFDLFHIGHLNIIKNAKSKCDFLIVGVTTDELSENVKKKKPVIPYAERFEIIKSLKYVDRVVAQESMNKFDAWQKYRFDKMFVGSDWKGTQKWIELEKDFEKLNVEVVYFPYTKNTSSTMLRDLLNKKLI